MNTIVSMFTSSSNSSSVSNSADDEKAKPVVSPPEPKEVFAEVLKSIVNPPRALASSDSPEEKKESYTSSVLQEWATRKLKDQRRNLSNEYVAGLSPVVSFATQEKINLMEREFNDASPAMLKDVLDVTIEKVTEANATILRRRIRENNRYAPFPDRKTFVDYGREQCRVVNQSNNIRIVPSGYNPWVYYVIMVPSTSYLSGTPIVGVMALPSGFPRLAPTFTHFASVGTRHNVNYYLDHPFRIDHSTSCNSLEIDWKKNNLCHGCKECLKRSVSCNVCNSDECKALVAEHKEWDYYCTWDTILQSFLLFYITVYVPQIRNGQDQKVTVSNYMFEAETSQTIKKTIVEQWAVYFQLIELFERHRDHFPPGEEVVYGKITDTRPLEIACSGGKMVSVPGVSIPPGVLAMGWGPKGRKEMGTITYTSEPMSLERTMGQGYSVILLPGESLFTDSKDFVLSFILSTEKPPGLHGIGRGVQRTLRWGIHGYKMEKKPHSESRWSNHGALTRQVFAVWLTFANDQFVVAVQETEASLPYVLSGVPVGRLSSVFRPQDKFYLTISMKTKVPVKRFTLDILPVTKGVVCNWDVPPVPTDQAMYAALVVRNSYALIDEAMEYVKIFRGWEDSDDLEEKHPGFQVGFDVYSLMWNIHSTLGHTNDLEYKNLLEHWKDYESNTLSTTLVVDAIHFDNNAVAFSVQSIEPPIKSLHEDFQHIVIGLMDAASGPKYVSTHLRKSDTYQTHKLEKPLVIDTRMMFVHRKV
jgi:hypothetical protein